MIAAEIAGADYYGVMNSGRLVPVYDSDEETKQSNQCHSARAYCESFDCFNFLLNQSLEVELDVFNQSWMKVVSKLKGQTN
jgi:hypothetical protein